MRNLIFRFVIISALAFSLFSCAVKYQRPEIETDALIRNADPADTSFDVTELNWRELYKDPILCDLIDTALAHNFDLQIAIKRMEQSAAYFKQSKWAIAPTVKASASGGYEKPDLATPETPYFTVGISASWEIDIWGRLSKAKKSRYQQLLSQENTKNAIITQLVAEVAQSYYNLISLDTEKEFVLSAIENREAYLQTVKSLKEAAQVNEIAVLQAESQLLAAQQYIIQIDYSISEVENQISILLGKAPSSIERNRLDDVFKINIPIGSAGLPANLLSNRPDVMAAEHDVIGSLDSYNSARAAMYPALTLTGNISSDATQFSNWFSMPSSLIWGVLGGLLQPILNGRALRTQKEVAYKDYEISIETFKKTVLNAGMEVSNYLASSKADQARTELLYKQYVALDKAYEYSVELLVNGYATYLDVLTAQEGVFDAQISLIEGVRDCLTDKILLYKSLGGGWSNE